MEKLDKTFAPKDAEAVLFHKGCNDGFGAAWVAHSVLGSKHVFYHAIAHGDEIPWEHLAGKNLVVFDFSWPRGVILKLKAHVGGFMLYDHHATAIDRCAGIVGCLVDLEESGATLAWHRFKFSNVAVESIPTIPSLLLYIRDRDLWKWQLRESRAFNLAFYVEFKQDFDSWTELSRTFNERFDGMVERGRAYATMRDHLVEPLGKFAYERKWCGLTCRVSEVSPRSLVSETGEAILKHHPSADVAICWTYEAKTRSFSVSLRSREGGTDVSEIARAVGKGGGHRAAAAFNFKEDSVEALFR